MISGDSYLELVCILWQEIMRRFKWEVKNLTKYLRCTAKVMVLPKIKHFKIDLLTATMGKLSKCANLNLVATVILHQIFM